MSMDKHTFGIKKVSALCESIIDCVNKTAPVVDFETPYKMIRTTNVKNGCVDTETVRYVEEEIFKKWTRRGAPQKGDVILTREAPLGEVGLLRNAKGIFLGQRLVMYRAHSEKLDNRFLLYAFMSHEVQGQIKSFGSGSTVEHMRVPDCGEIEIPAPSLPAQKRIADILSAYDDLIENNRRRIQILEEMAQNLYREWFVKFRFPIYREDGTIESIHNPETDPMQDSPLGPIPERWEVKALGDLIDIKKGKNITKAKVKLGTVPVVAGGLTPAYYHNEPNVKGPAITVSASGANSGYVNIYFEDIWASDCSYINQDTERHIFYRYLHMRDVQNEIYGMQRGSAQPHVYPKDLERLTVCSAPDSLLEDFEKTVSKKFALINLLSNQNVNLKQQRDMLLPKLISGKVDVGEDDC